MLSHAAFELRVPPSFQELMSAADRQRHINRGEALYAKGNTTFRKDTGCFVLPPTKRAARAIPILQDAVQQFELAQDTDGTSKALLALAIVYSDGTLDAPAAAATYERRAALLEQSDPFQAACNYVEGAKRLIEASIVPEEAIRLCTAAATLASPSFTLLPFESSPTLAEVCRAASTTDISNVAGPTACSTALRAAAQLSGNPGRHTWRIREARALLCCREYSPAAVLFAIGATQEPIMLAMRQIEATRVPAWSALDLACRCAAAAVDTRTTASGARSGDDGRHDARAWLEEYAEEALQVTGANVSPRALDTLRMLISACRSADSAAAQALRERVGVMEGGITRGESEGGSGLCAEAEYVVLVACAHLLGESEEDVFRAVLGGEGRGSQ